VEILVLHPGALGDIILSLPALALLRNKFPSARITIAGNIDHLEPVMSGYADSVLSLSTLPLHRLYSPDALPESEVRFWRSFDRIVSWTGGADPAFTGKFKSIHPNVSIASWRPALEEKKHVSQLFIDSLNLGIDAATQAAPAPILLNSEWRDVGKQWLIERGWNGCDSLTALHPGAGSKTKWWPIARFVELARHFAFQEKRKLLIIEGAAERGLASQIMHTLPATETMLFDSMSLSLLAPVLENCALFIGNDSGLAHLAAALNVRCVVLFGPTLPQHWAPLGRHVTVLRNPHGCEACAATGSDHLG
jgi:hypothetical protein